jgi:hypothetical protein
MILVLRVSMRPDRREAAGLSAADPIQCFEASEVFLPLEMPDAESGLDGIRPPDLDGTI